MHTIDVRNVNYALEAGAEYIRRCGVRRESRNGTVLVAPEPVTTVYRRPTERVLFSARRDANPFFHLVEALWMLAGRRGLKTLTPYVLRMAQFSDDGKTLHGAYGYRWRRHFDHDQLPWAINRLRSNPDDRRVVIQMYDTKVDQPATDRNGKDIPCNLLIMPWVDVNSCLSMTVVCRSNDMVWGAYGANAVHFSVLQEYLAHGVGVPVGALYQVSNNFHAYLETLDKAGETLIRSHAGDEYALNQVEPYPMFRPKDSLRHFDEDLTIFFDEPGCVGLRTAWLRRVAAPMVLAHHAYGKRADPERFSTALEVIGQCQATDWAVACRQWLGRRQAALIRATDDGVDHAA